MGDRAVISNKNKELGVYLHWYGYREFVESILAYCDAKNYRNPDVDSEYGWARICQVAGNTIGGSLSLGVGMFDKMDTDNWDNGTYIIEGWDIKERLYQQYDDELMKESMYDNLKYINEKQPEDERLEDEEIKAFADYWDIKHLDRLNDERRATVEERIKNEHEEQDKKITNIERTINNQNSKNELSKEDKAKIQKLINDLSSDTQEPLENNLKEDNEVNEIEKKGDEEIERDK